MIPTFNICLNKKFKHLAAIQTILKEKKLQHRQLFMFFGKPKDFSNFIRKLPSNSNSDLLKSCHIYHQIKGHEFTL